MAACNTPQERTVLIGGQKILSEMFAYRITSRTTEINEMHQEFENKLEAISLIGRNQHATMISKIHTHQERQSVSVCS